MRSDFVALMNETPGQSRGYDVIIVTTHSPQEAAYWQDRLTSTKGIVSNRECRILSVHEDWNSENGAGTLLGTLYAWKNAEKKAYSTEGVSLAGELASGKSIAIYHIAGLGARLAPLHGAECNSKSAVKLPCLISSETSQSPMTILEGVILQTGPFARSRGGRLSVWWGDQIFIPSRFEGPATHHIEMFARKTKVSPAMESYGLLLPGEYCSGKLREKMKIEQIDRCVPPDPDGERYAYISMGSFSISSAFLHALLLEFEPELKGKNVRHNSDADLWQPLTSTLEEYLEAGRSSHTWARVSRFWKSFEASPGFSGLKKLGFIDMGDSFWWDFGNVRSYQENLLKIMGNTREGEVMRDFFRVGSWPVCISESDTGSTEIVDSLIIGSTIKQGSVRNSIVLNSHLKEAELDHCIVIESVVMKRLLGSLSISYRDMERDDLLLATGEASAGIFVPPATRFRMRLKITANGKDNWRKKILDNPCTFFEVWQLQKGVDCNEQEAFFRHLRDELIDQAL